MIGSIILIAWLLCGGITAYLAISEFGEYFSPFDYFMCFYALICGPVGLLGWFFAGRSK
jgi:hypothetical protein